MILNVKFLELQTTAAKKEIVNCMALLSLFPVVVSYKNIPQLSTFFFNLLWFQWSAKHLEYFEPDLMTDPTSFYFPGRNLS